MKKLIIYGLMIVAVFSACETVYNPDIDEQENVLVIDARIVNGQSGNYIYLTKSMSFTEDFSGYPRVPGQVTIIDSDGNENLLPEVESGVYEVNFSLDPTKEYKISVEYSGDTYESSFVPVPDVPVLDSIYGIPEIKVVHQGGETNVNDFREKEGVQLYADMVSEEEMPYYRFSARKVMQYTYEIEVPFFGSFLPVLVYGWKSYFPQQTFNIAAPPEYSATNQIRKHPLFFLDRKGPVQGEQAFNGWILIMNQYGLSGMGHSYYKDLNNQLESDGKLFDPLYVQARNNLKCLTDPERIVLGNFEISTVKERRYYVLFISQEKGYLIKPIEEFYPIPLRGEIEGTPPDFWQNP